MKNLPTGCEDDVSMSRDWNSILDIDETVIITLLQSEADPALGNSFLTLSDPDSNHSIYLSSTLEIEGGGMSIPKTITIFLMSIGLKAGGKQPRVLKGSEDFLRKK